MIIGLLGYSLFSNPTVGYLVKTGQNDSNRSKLWFLNTNIAGSCGCLSPNQPMVLATSGAVPHLLEPLVALASCIGYTPSHHIHNTCACERLIMMNKTAHGSIPRLKILFSWTPEQSEQSVWKILFLKSACLGPCWIQGRNRLLNPFLRSHLATFQQWPANWWPRMDLCSSGLPMWNFFRTKHPISQSLHLFHLWSLLLNHQTGKLITAYHSLLELHHYCWILLISSHIQAPFFWHKLA